MAEAPVTKIVAVIIRHAVESRASDIHIEPFEDRVRCRFRVDGVLVTALTLPKNLDSAVVTRIKILSDLKIDETRLAQDGRFSTRLNDRKIDFRVSTFPTKNGEKVVMRILDPLSGKVDLPDLGLDGRALEVMTQGMAKPFGAILITGPTGSGKSTTLAGMLKRMNTDDINIVTLEDPIEYYVDGVNQSQVHEEIGYTFAAGLRHILRQDPDVIMVGEIRDRETASLATQAALTGHIVLSTLHTNDAIGAIPRLIDMGVEKYLLPSTLNVAGAQRLLRKLCADCKLETKANPAETVILENAIKDMPASYQKELLSKDGYTIYKPNLENPCKQCGGKAFKGRIGIFEMMEMTPECEKIILGNISETALREEAKRQGMITMFQDGILKVLKGGVSLEELLEVAQAGESA
jgi:type IV pilus assembly protein PilB